MPNRLGNYVITSITTLYGTADIDDGNDEEDEQEDEDSDDESIEILDHFPPHLETKEKSPLESQPRKRKRHSSRTLIDIFPEERPVVPRKMHPPITASSGKVPRANGFESANPDFKILLKPAYIHGNYLVSLFIGNPSRLQR